MTALGLDVGSRWTKLAWRADDGPKVEPVEVPRNDLDALRSTLDATVSRMGLGRFDDVVVAVPEHWRNKPDPAAKKLVRAVRAVVGDATIRLVGTPVAAAYALAELAPDVTLPMVVDAGVGTVEVAVLRKQAMSDLPGLLRYHHDVARGPNASKKLFSDALTPLLLRGESPVVAVVGGRATEDGLVAAIRSAAGPNVTLRVRNVDDPQGAAARGALYIAERHVDPVRYPWPVKAEVGLRREGLLINEKRGLVAENELEIGGFTTCQVFGADEPVRIDGGGVGDLPRLWVETSGRDPDRYYELPEPIGDDLPSGRYTVSLHLDRRRSCSLLLRSVDASGPAVALTCGLLPLGAFPDRLTHDIDRISSWGVRETRHIPEMREVVENVRRKLREPRFKALNVRVDDKSLINAVLTETDLSKKLARSAWRIWNGHIKPGWAKIDIRITYPGNGRVVHHMLRELWEPLRRTDAYLQGLPEAEWPSWPADSSVTRH